MSQGIYVSPCSNEPNRDRKDICVTKLSLWIIEFLINNTYTGCAVVKASNPKEAESLLKKDGIFNGSPNMYKITRIEEINESPETMLICEQIND